MKKPTIISLLLFVLGFGGFMFTRTSTLVPLIPVAILIAPVFILRFSRTLPASKGILLTLLGFLLSFNVALWGLFKFDDVAMMNTYSLIRSSMLAIVWFMPYMVDRLIHPKFADREIWSSLTFPVVLTAMFFLSSLEGPFDDGSGTLGSFSFGHLTFQQAYSLFGVWTYVFLYSWFHAIVNYWWERGFEWRYIKWSAIIYAGIISSIWIYGYVKTTAFASAGLDTVKVAAVVLLPEDGQAVRMERIFNQKVTSPMATTIKRIDSQVQQAANQGAKIVSFQEFAMTIQDKDESALVQQYQKIAEDHNVYLSITYAYFGREEKGENKHLFISPDGEILLDYTKRYLLGFGPFGETAVFKKGPEVIQSVDTPYGRIGLSICRDMSFTSYLRQAARADVDIMLSPAYDWPKSSGPYYLLSTINNGFSLVRPTYNGYSYAADYHGKILAHMESDTAKDGIMYAEVPTKGIKTLYPIVGEGLGWLSVIGLMGLLLYRPSKKGKT
ncbi:MAG: carbon-nitrogen hydrolase family protein [Cyclobacteriaceae bacterium]